ncbi:chorismate-binding protein [Halanaerobium sp. Z-7514]|uniref:Chorismate-binding protein n=1 Tax=Halanaerobium polyolivorans TaxID=2886943 RepID=A0AAW4X1V5_9FIRM|nr:chorismate-binding protein [Halanaerobium polyolivorans]
MLSSSPERFIRSKNNKLFTRPIKGTRPRGKNKVEDLKLKVDCIKNIFPGGSITGAPKIRAMEIIDELEPTQRNIYTGSIGYLDFNGNMDLNIVIRTMLTKNKKVYFQVGGGIVWDSNAAAEYQESLDKGKALVEALKR